MKTVQPNFSAFVEENTCRKTLLAPMGWKTDSRFRRVTPAPREYSALISGIQRFRGSAYLEDGALQPEDLTACGRHEQPMDRNSWHFVTHDGNGDVISCARYHPIADPTFDSTTVSRSALARSEEWRPKLRSVVENSIRAAASRDASFAELGGWCVAPAARKTTHALRTVLYMYALTDILGGCVGLSTATKRHSSSSILQRLGAKKAGVGGEELPAYFEPKFDCEMELLEFDSRRPAARYSGQVQAFRSEILRDVEVVCSPVETVPMHSLSGLMNALRIDAGMQFEFAPVRRAA